MKLPKHTERSQTILTRIANWGFPDDVLQRVGALALVWGQFESNLETAVWALRGEDVAGTRPWTDKTSVRAFPGLIESGGIPVLRRM